MFPVSMCSGILFPLLGAQLREWIDVETRAAGLLTFANTIGAMLGSLLACFALLPVAGVEVSLFGLAAGYGVVALLAVTAPFRRRAAPLFVFGTVFAAVLALFPFGLMEGHYLAISIERYQQPGSTRVVDVRESLTETIVLLEYTKHGEPVDYQLITNGFSMSGTSVYARRYMKLYVYWPVALRPDPRSALLISYGVGSTAKALTDTKSFESIDVVDISEGILEMSEQIFSPPDNPLGDPRVRVHVEDGRYFLQTTERRFDLITGEPPPPKKAGVVNLYTREYFQLVHDRLREQGVATYWLPVHSLLVNDSRAIIRAFCDAFDDCSLWGGMRFDWMLVGTRGLRGPPREEEFSRQWRDPVVGPELRALGFEVPEQLAALFMADAPALDALTRGVAPLTDDRPQRLSRRPVNPRSRGVHRSWMDTQVARRAFLNSAFIASLWPQALRQRSLQAFDTQRIINEHLLGSAAPGSVKLQDLFRILLGSQLETLPLWVLGSSADEQRIVERLWRPGGKIPALDYRRAIGAVAQRDYALAGVLFERAAAGLREPLDQERTLVNCLKEHAENTESFASRVGTADFDQWYSQNCRSGNSRPGAKSLSSPATSK
ncbi:MAG: fused MFS/spermidine synthase [Myxococcota bacterium]